MMLSRREGVDIRPTLLRVLTDLYVQASAHSADEERQFVELTSRLIEQVDDATRAAVRARLAVYPATPAEVMNKLGLRHSHPGQSVPVAPAIPSSPVEATPAKAPTEAQLRMASNLSMRPNDAAEISDMFFAAGGSERALILHNLSDKPLKASARIPAARALDMPSAAFQRVLMFLNPEFGSSVNNVYRLSRLYDRLTERSALVMLAAWRGSTMAVTRAKYRPALYEDERNRVRAATPQTRPALQPGSAPGVRAKSSSGS